MVDIHVEVASGVCVSVQDVGDGTRLERRLAGMLTALPAATSDGEGLRVVLGDDVTFHGSRIDWYVRAGDDGIALTDHGRRLAVVPLPGLDPVVVARDFDARTFVEGVYVPLLRAALWDRGGMLVRAAGIEFGGRRLLICGWHESGKTQLVLHALRRGGALLGDDFVAVDGHGVVSCASASVYLRPPGRRSRAGEEARPAPWPGRLASRVASRSSTLATALWGAERLARQRRTVTLPVGEAVPGARPATPGQLDAVVVLRPGGGDLAPRTAARMLTRLGHHHFAGSVRLDALATYLTGGNADRTLLPPGAAEEERLADVLVRTRVVSHERTDAGGLSTDQCDAILADVA